MSGSNRSERNQAVGNAFSILAGFALVTLIVAVLAYSQGKETQKRQQAPAAYAEAAKQDAVKACANGEAAAVFECIYERVEASQEQARAEQDLDAQQGMNLSAAIMALLTLLTFTITAVGVWFVKRTLDATLEAVEDTGKATKAMERQNELTLAAQRAWITLQAVPKLARTQGIKDDLYLRIDICATNTGASAGTHFGTRHKVYFVGQSGDSRVIGTKLRSQVGEWIREHKHGPQAVIMPGETNVDQIQNTFDHEEVDWRRIMGPMAHAYPIVLAAVLYRTVDKPDTLQVSWRSWFIHTINGSGQVESWIGNFLGDGLGPSELCAEPHHMSLAHEEYPTNDDKRNRADG